MTPPQLAFPPLVVDYDGNWLCVDLKGDLDAWSRAAALEVLLRDDPKPAKRALRNQAEYLLNFGQLATRVQDSVLSFLLCPPPQRRVLAVLRLVALELEDDDLANGIAAALRLVAPDGLRYVEPPEVSEFVTQAGQAARSRARYEDGSEQHLVHESLNYLWIVPGYRYGALLTTAFGDLVQAGQCRPAVDALARGVALAQP